MTFPCLIVWGACDETLPLSMGYKLQAQLPDATLVILHNTKHLMQLERPRLSSSVLREFIESGVMSQNSYGLLLIELESDHSHASPIPLRLVSI